MEEESTEIECPRCGTQVYYELTTCPKCGLNFYEPEGSDFPTSPQWGINPAANRQPHQPWGMLALGVLVAFGVGFGVNRLLAAWAGPVLTGWELALHWAALPLGALLAGWIASREPWRSPWLPAGMLGLLCGLFALLFDAYWFPSPWRPAGLASVLASFGLAPWVLMWRDRVAQEQAVSDLFFPPETETSLYQELYAKTGFDTEVVNRLLEYERQRAPYASRKIHLQNAIARWKRDNRV